MIPRMASNICKRLLDQVHESNSKTLYANDLDKAPQAEGTYATGKQTTVFGTSSYIFVEHSSDGIHRRL